MCAGTRIRHWRPSRHKECCNNSYKILPAHLNPSINKYTVEVVFFFFSPYDVLHHKGKFLTRIDKRKMDSFRWFRIRKNEVLKLRKNFHDIRFGAKKTVNNRDGLASRHYI